MNFQGSKWHWKVTLAICLILFLVSCQPAITTSPYTSENCRVGDHAEELTSGGQVREYRLHVPSTYRPGNPMALVLAFHGAGSNAADFEIYSKFSSMADRAGFIVVYPQALGGHPTWNTTPGSNNPDIEFVRNLIQEVESRCNIDRNRIYASGHSNGGGMANRLACDMSDLIAAIGTVSGAYQWSEDCSPSRPVAVFAIHGTDDLIIPYRGYPDAKQPPAAYYTIGVPIPQWASSWGKRNECDPEPAGIAHNDLISEKKWSNCRARADVVLYSIGGGGHEWPSDLIDVAQLFWDFFAEHPL